MGHDCGSERRSSQTQQLLYDSTTTANPLQVITTEMFAFTNANHLTPSLPCQLYTITSLHSSVHITEEHTNIRAFSWVQITLSACWPPPCLQCDSLSSSAPACSQLNPYHWPQVQCRGSGGDCGATCDCTDPRGHTIACRPSLLSQLTPLFQLVTIPSTCVPACPPPWSLSPVSTALSPVSTALCTHRHRMCSHRRALLQPRPWQLQVSL